MTTTMVRSLMLTALVHILLGPLGAQCRGPEDGAAPPSPPPPSPPPSGALELPWRAELCCDSPAAHRGADGGGHELHLPHDPPHCDFRGSTDGGDPHEASGGTCLEILCRVNENWENLTCHHQPRSPGTPEAGTMAISFQMKSHKLDPVGKEPASDGAVECEATNSFTCSVSVDWTTGVDAVVAVGVSGAAAPPVLLRVPPRPERPAPPVDLAHRHTVEAGLTLVWGAPPGADAALLRYEVRYSCSKSEDPTWQVLPAAAGELQLSLDLKPKLNYSVQVRCSAPGEPPRWSGWSQPHHIHLPVVSYLPQKAVVRPGENVTVYCVFNDRSVDASDAVWTLNLQHLVDRSQYGPVNQWVSQVTLSPSEDRMYDLLRCTHRLSSPSKPYAQVYTQGAPIDIKCETNGDIDAMVCTWISKQWTKTTFRSKWADMTCDVMEESERAGEDVGEVDPTCTPARSRLDTDPTCTIQPLRMNCYKLWVEVPSIFGPIRSRPVYVYPIDHVKPYPPTNVRAVTQSNGVLRVTWTPPSLPAQGLQCQFRFRSQSAASDPGQWEEESPVRAHEAEAAVPDMCRVYVAQVRCMHTNSTGYWSEWSESVNSRPQNSRAPERGPDFWRIRQDEPNKLTANVTLLLKELRAFEGSYCVEGLVVQHRVVSGAVTRRRIDRTSSYSFEWNQEPQTVTVEAYNNLGSSRNNINMTLERRPKRLCVRSFHVMVVNSSCVSLSWSLLDNSSSPLFMVVQWSPRRQHDSGASGETWTRLPYVDHPVYLRGELFASEEYGFHLYPVFADGEGEPVFTVATRRDPAAYMLMMIISFLAIVLFVTLVFSQNHSRVKRFVWKDVPNPRNCSWARGMDFKKVETFDHLFQPPDTLLPSEKISKVYIVDKTRTAALVQNPFGSRTDPASSVAVSFSSGSEQCSESEAPLGGAPCVSVLLEALTTSDPEELEPFGPAAGGGPGTTETSDQSSVTYATVLPSNLTRDQPVLHHLHDKEGSGSSSSDEGNFSANNSDISGSFPGGLWDMDDPRRSCSYNSVEEFSETSEHEEELEVRGEKDLYYPGMDYAAEDEESEEEEDQEEEEEEEEQRDKEAKTELLPNAVRAAESRPLLGPKGGGGVSSLYLPQFRTAACTRPHEGGPPEL